MEGEEIKLSIIVPVYNVSAFLPRCLESLLHQAVENYEVILVDDGSTDNSGEKCDVWCRTHEAFRVVHQENKGLSGARNTGIEHARGEWITFLDSDDYLSPETYARVMQQLQPDDDFIEFPVSKFCGSPQETRLHFKPAVFRDATTYWIKQKGYEHAYAWNKIYRKSIFSQVRFPEKKNFEDVYAMSGILRIVKQIRVTDVGLYYYVYNPAGITATASGNDLRSLLHAHLDYWDVTIDAEYYLHVLNIQLDVCRLTGEAPALPLMPKLQHAGLPLRARIKMILLNILGINGLCRINKLWWKIRRGR